MINYRGTPLFGEDSSPRNTSEFFALGGTLLFWLLFMLCMIFVRPKPQKPKYKEVQIVLSSTPVIEKTAVNPAPSAASAPAAPAPEPAPIVETAPAPEAVEQPKPAEPKKTEPKKVEKKTVEPKKAEPKKTQPAPQPKKTETVQKPKPAPAPAPVQETPIEYAVDPMEAFNAQTKKQPKQEFNWDMFEDDSSDDVPAQTTSHVVDNSAPTFEGTAAVSTTSASENLTSQTSSKSPNQNNTVTNATSSALGNIANTKYTGRATNGVSSETTVRTAASGTGGVAMEMSNGRSRALLDPAKPVINLSAEASATIDGSRTVTIKFKVVESGNVPRAEITISPESILAEIVRNEIKDQISKWRFDAADYSAMASFEYKIVKQ